MNFCNFNRNFMFKLKPWEELFTLCLLTLLKIIPARPKRIPKTACTLTDMYGTIPSTFICERKGRGVLGIFF